MPRAQIRGGKCFPFSHSRGKLRYSTPVEALQAVQRIKDKGLAEQWQYKCKHCKGYHLTSQDPATYGGDA